MAENDVEKGIGSRKTILFLAAGGIFARTSTL